jgi:hypothetical protein
MKKTGLLIIVMISCLMIGPVSSYGMDTININATEKIELEKAWKIFLKAVSARDITKIKSLSVEKIRCLYCVDNTEAEDREMEKFRATDPDWYRKLYEEKIFIPVDRFCSEDFSIIFTEKFIRKLRDGKPSYLLENMGSIKIYEIMITTAKPGEIGPGHEGGVHLFQFVKTGSGYKFWGIDTIP